METISNPPIWVSDLILNTDSIPIWNVTLIRTLLDLGIYFGFTIRGRSKVFGNQLKKVLVLIYKNIYKSISLSKMGHLLPWSKLWKLQITPKIKFFKWKSFMVSCLLCFISKKKSCLLNLHFAFVAVPMMKLWNI